MAATTTKAICVWLDRDTDPNKPAWIVSRDNLDDADNAITTFTLHTFEVEADEDARIDTASSRVAYNAAVECAKQEAIKRELPVYRNPSDGPAYCLISADQIGVE